MKNWNEIEGWWSQSDACVTSLVAQWLTEDALCVEIGAWMGRSTACLLQEVQLRGKKIKLYAVDSWGGSVQEEWQVRTVSEQGGADAMLSKFEQNIIECGVHEMLTPIRSLSLDAAERFADNSLDFVFIDGDHSEEAVFADITAWMPKLKSRGIIAGHDVHWPSVQAGVNKFFGIGQCVFLDNCWLHFLR